jgi:tetratricopeptide (TPR) repeat protein
MGGPQAQVDFFISYTAADRAWAEWIAWQLEDARYTTTLQAWDFRPGENFVVRMRDALGAADRTLAVVSAAYLASPYCTDEWTGAFLHDPGGKGRLLLVRVEDCQLPRLLATSIYVDLADAGQREATARLLEGIRQGRAKPERAPPFPRSAAGRRAKEAGPRFPGTGPEISNLPRRNPNFTGRRELLESLRANLRAGVRGAVLHTEAVHGLGGVGKTELALEYAHRYATDYDLMWWVVAERPPTVATSLVELAGRLGIGEAAEPAETIGELFDELRGQGRWLLVFDNAEAPQELADYLPPGGSGHVLVTSRYATWGRLAAPVRLDVLAREEAVAFVRKRIGVGDESVAAALVDALGGLPLALEEAAAYIEATGIGLDDYLELVDERMIELFGLNAPADTVQTDERRVATIWSVSLDRVRTEAPGAEALLALCAFLAPDIPRSLLVEHAEVLPAELTEVARDLLRFNDTIRVLGRYSLVTATPNILALHRLVQAVIRTRLGKDAERQWAQVAIALLRDAFPSMSWELAIWPACQQLLPHVLAATEHAQRLDLAGQQVGWLLDRTARYLHGRGQYQEAKPVAQRALAVTQQALSPNHARVGERHAAVGRVLEALGDYQGARQHYQQALTIGETTEGQEAFAVGLRHSELGTVLWRLGDLAGARSHHKRALEIGQATAGPNHPTMASRHNNLGAVLHGLGDLVGARTQFERALEIGQATLGPNHPHMAIWHGSLGTALRRQGDLVGARTRYERALEITEATLGPQPPHHGHPAQRPRSRAARTGRPGWRPHPL